MEEGFKKVIECYWDKFWCVIMVERLFFFFVVSYVVNFEEV